MGVNEDSEATAVDRARRGRLRGRLLGAGGAALAVAVFAMCIATGVVKVNPLWEHTVNALGHPANPTTSAAAPVSLVDTSVAEVHSHTDGRLTLVAVFPANTRTANEPVVLLLPGAIGDPRRPLPGLSKALADAAAAGGQPFAVVALEGRERCWHQSRPGADPMDVLIKELPAWLSAHHLGGSAAAPVSVVGVGTGGFDALVYARRRNESGHPLGAVAVIGPSLATSWPQVRDQHAFLDSNQWRSLDPLRHVAALGHTAVGVWSADRDPNRAGVEELVKLAHPQAVHLGRPGRAGRGSRAELDSALRFIGRHLPGAGHGTDSPRKGPKRHG